MSNSHHVVEITVKTPSEVNNEVLGWSATLGSKYRLAVGITGLLFLLGIVGFFIKVQDGFDDYVPWAYLTAAFGFVMLFAMSAPMLAIVPRLARGHWGRPISRIAELWALVGVLLLIVMIPLLLALPEADGRNTFWFVDKYREGWPPGAPHIWLALLMIGLVVNGIALLWAAAIPDFAAIRDKNIVNGKSANLYGKLSLGWRGSKRQWRGLRASHGVLGALYFATLIWSHTMVSFDFSQSLVPGMRDSIYPTWYALSGLQSGLGLVLVTAFIARRFGNLKDYIHINQFWSAAKILLALSLLWAYFWWSGFIIYWYGKNETEMNIIQLFWFGAYRPLFILNIVLSFFIPFIFLIWNRIRKSDWGPSLVGFVVIVGSLVNCIRIYTASFSLPDGAKGHALHHVPDSIMKPDLPDVLMVTGLVSGAILLYLIAIRYIPIISTWEIREGMLYQTVRNLHKLPLKVIGKPD
ncbi:MAG: hypothetical protein CL785_05660 [Chloroflexi bacterium]|nr:hypothetical protein [Chloroflexota bacterium]|tara:strand:- start:39480 stop:40877 length:1398 start_codon:yes stop_codon:yes gene_type:complete